MATPTHATGTVARRRAAAYGAAAWAIVFGLMSCAWGAGVLLGSETLGVEIDRLARERDAGFVATLWLTGAAKLVAALLPLALAHPPRWLAARADDDDTGAGTGPPLPRHRLVVATALVGAGMTLYALLNLLQHALMAADLIATPDGLGSDAVPWHLALWDPFWLLGGLLFLAAARAARQDRRAAGRMG